MVRDLSTRLVIYPTERLRSSLRERFRPGSFFLQVVFQIPIFNAHFLDHGKKTNVRGLGGGQIKDSCLHILLKTKHTLMEIVLDNRQTSSLMYLSSASFSLIHPTHLMHYSLDKAYPIEFPHYHASRRRNPPTRKQGSKTTLMNPHRPQIIILRAGHKPLTQPLIDHKHHLGRDLRAQKPRLLHPTLFPLREIIRHLQRLDTSRCLRVAGMLMVQGLLVEEELVLLGMGLRGGSEGGVVGCG